MRIVDLIKTSARLSWQRKSLWLFGFFLAGSSGGGGDPATMGGDPSELPLWVIPAIVGAVVLGIAGLIMHVISEGALIEGVQRGSLGVREGMRVGWQHFGVVLRIKALAIGVGLVSMGVLTAPAWMNGQGWIDTPAAIVLGIPAVLIGVPFAVTLYLIYAFSLRIAVLENRHALDAMRKARLFLHGRLRTSLELILAMAAGHAGFAAGAVVVMLPVGAIGLGLYFLAGMWPAVIVAGVLGLPLMIAGTSMLGTYRSSVWTLGYLQSTRS